MDTFLSCAQQIKEELLGIRRTIHHRPEVGIALPKTKAYVTEKLREFGYAPEEICESGIVGQGTLLEGGLAALAVTPMAYTH